MKEVLFDYFKSGFNLMAINTIEINRAIKEIENVVKEWNHHLINTNASDFLKANGYSVLNWTITQGWIDQKGEKITTKKDYSTPEKATNLMVDTEINPSVCILQNYNWYWDDPMMRPNIIQNILTIAKAIRPSKHLVVVGSFTGMPAEIANLFTFIDFSLPCRDEIIKLITDKKYGEKVKEKMTLTKLEALADAASGMTLYEVEKAIRYAIIKGKGKTISEHLLHQQKADIVKRNGLLTYVESAETIKNVGGVAPFKEWLNKIEYVFKNREAALKFNLPLPRGCLITGISGTGKSLIAKAIANGFGLPLFQCDIGKLYGGIVGETENNMRELFKLIDAVSPAVISIDEVEKAFSGYQSSGTTDSGVASRLMGGFLTYLQDKTSTTFFVFTANSVDKLPPEFLRKGGRMNEIFFVDLPSVEERQEIFKIHLTKVGREIKKFDIKKLAAKAIDFTGAEIQGIIEDALFSAFKDGKDITDKYILTAIKDTSIVARIKEQEIKALRKWAVGRARFANAAQLPAWWGEEEKDTMITDTGDGK